ncbi:hypothetical protein Y032_0252g244 [Ancylostoma ceylanicum]|nr:hypothetical protein Y032_0252g244 [Ancylostoma ceylanicum]
MENIVQQFYTELFRSSTLVPRCPPPPPDDVRPILEPEVGQAMKSMKRGIAPGPDNIPADWLRAGSPHSVLASHFNHYLRKAALQYAELDWKDEGYSINGKKISNLRFADDIVLIAHSMAEMEAMVNELKGSVSPPVRFRVITRIWAYSTR